MPNPILQDIVVHDSLPSPMEVIQSHDGIDFGVDAFQPHIHVQDEMQPEADMPEEIVVELHGDDSEDLSLGIPEEGDHVPEGADVVVLENDEPVLAIDLGDLPGAPPGTEDPKMEVEEDVDSEKSSESSEKKSSDSNDAKDTAKKDNWDWKSKGFGNFTVWVRDRFQSVPKHSGYSEAGLDRAKAYLERLHGEISKAMRSDIDGELDSDTIAKIHEQIEEGIERLEGRLEKVKGGKKKKRAEDEQSGLVKEAQKVFGIKSGVVITVPLFISTLARVLVNGAVSAGKDIEHSYELMVKKYKLTDREKIELIQIVQDMGFPTIRDRSLLPDEVLDPESTDNLDYSANYKA